MRLSRISFVLALVVGSLVACGPHNGAGDTSQDGNGAGAGKDGAGGGSDGCPKDLFAAENSVCFEEGKTCGDAGGDPCTFGNILQCSGNVWRRLEIFPGGCGGGFGGPTSSGVSGGFGGQGAAGEGGSAGSGGTGVAGGTGVGGGTGGDES